MTSTPAMSEVVQLWVYLSATPLFGLTATLSVYVVAQAVYQRLDHAPWANPVLWTVLALAGLLLATGTPYPAYFSGAQFIHFLLGPAVVALGYDLIWFGVLFNITMQVGYLSPPFGQAAFYLKSVAPPEISLNLIFQAMLPFIALQVVGLAFVLFFPQITLWLPSVIK